MKRKYLNHIAPKGTAQLSGKIILTPKKHLIGKSLPVMLQNKKTLLTKLSYIQINFKEIRTLKCKLNE